MRSGVGAAVAATDRRPAVAGTFYPAEPARLVELVDALLRAAAMTVPADGAPGRRSTAADRPPTGLLVPHAGLVYSGLVAAAAWRTLQTPQLLPGRPARPTVVILGTNHRAAWLDGVGIFPAGTWSTPLGTHEVDAELADAVAALGPPYLVAPAAHALEHSIEVQLPILGRVVPSARILPLAVAAGTGDRAAEAGYRLGSLVADRCRAGHDVVLAISSDMAHYPSHGDSLRVTAELLPPILALDPTELADRERALVGSGIHGLACGMCGIEPAVLGLAALRAAGVRSGIQLAAATSADAGGPRSETVGYLAVAFDAEAGDATRPAG